MICDEDVSVLGHRDHGRNHQKPTPPRNSTSRSCHQARRCFERSRVQRSLVPPSSHGTTEDGILKCRRQVIHCCTSTRSKASSRPDTGSEIVLSCCLSRFMWKRTSILNFEYDYGYLYGYGTYTMHLGRQRRMSDYRFESISRSMFYHFWEIAAMSIYE